MNLDLETPELFDVDLITDVEAVLGRAVPPDDRQGGRLRVGRPLTRALTSSTVGGDAELRAFIASEAATHDYHLIRIVCTFADDDSRRFDSAWIKLDLSRADEVEDPEQQPIAWSMEPERLSSPAGVVHKIGLQVPVKLATASYGAEISDPDQTFIDARYATSMRPTWYLHRTRQHRIDGDVDLRLVARIPAGRPGRADLSMGAKVTGRFAGVIPHIADLRDLTPVRQIAFGGPAGDG